MQKKDYSPAIENRVSLITVSDKYAANWLQWRSQESSQNHMPLIKSSTEDLKKRLLLCTSDLSDVLKSEYRWIVEFDGEAIGTVAASNTSWHSGYTEISYILSETYQGQGLAKNAVSLMIEKIFQETDLYRIFATISSDNIRSWKLVERLGFIQEGILRQHYLINGNRVDQMIYGLLRPEWELNCS